MSSLASAPLPRWPRSGWRCPVAPRHHGGCQAQSRRPDQDERHRLPRSGPAGRANGLCRRPQHLRQARARYRRPRSARPSQARGYRVVDDPRAAHFVLQANVLQAGRSSETAAERPTMAASAARSWAVPQAVPPATGWAGRPRRQRSAGRHRRCAGRRRDLYFRRRLRPGHDLHHRHRRPDLRAGCRRHGGQPERAGQPEPGHLRHASPSPAARPPTSSAIGRGSSARPTRSTSTGEGGAELVAGLTRSIAGIF